MTKEKKAIYDKDYKKKNRDKIKTYNQQFYQQNRERDLSKRKEYNNIHKAEIRNYQRVYYRFKCYGIDKNAFDQMLKIQKSSCSICETLFDFTKKTLSPHVDHDHITGKVRKLLCMKCNCGIGNFNDNPLLLKKASVYLEGFKL